MEFWTAFLRRYCWVAALAAALAIATVDTVAQTRKTVLLTDTNAAMPPAPDASSPSGYADDQHNLVLPYIGMDGYHWVMQTQQMLATGDARIREVDYDNAPAGREVHWSSSFRWWLAALAEIDHFYTATPLPLAVEDVIPFANTLLIGLIIIVVTPVFARRFGAVAAALWAFGTVAVGPFYESFSEGRTDHHGLASMDGLLTLLLLLGGGAGWVRVAAGSGAWLAWLPGPAQARRWFIASGLVAGAGLWISAASEVPVLCGVGLGALLAQVVVGRRGMGDEGAEPAPELWRAWGLAGAGASLFFYFLEYFPSHFGWRLEVNHPLYALAFAGGGEALCRLGRWARGERPGPRDWAWLAASVAAVGVLPVVVFLIPQKVFWVNDPFLWDFHVDYIMEFVTMWTYMKSQSLWIIIIMANPLVLLALPMAWWGGRGGFPRPLRALLLLALPPALLTFLLAVWQIRWIEINYGIWLAALAAVVTALRLHMDFRWNWPRRLVAGGFLAWVFLPGPINLVVERFQRGMTEPVSELEALELLEREVAQNLRRRLGDSPAVVLSGPTTTTCEIYWGGFQGLGTFYWENLPGLKASAEIYAASTDGEALRLIKKYGVTHIVIMSWDANDEAYARLAHGLRINQPAPADAFMIRLLRGGDLPPWLRLIPTAMPPGPVYHNRWVAIFEVVPDQTTDLAAVRLGEARMDMGDPGAAARNLAAALSLNPQSAPALIALARLQYSQNQSAAFAAVMRRLRAALGSAGPLDFEDAVDLATVFSLEQDRDLARAQILACLRAANPALLRRLRPDALFNLLSLARQLGLADARPGLWPLASALLPASQRVQLLLEYAAGFEQGRDWRRALAVRSQTLALAPDSLPALANLARLLATMPDAALRNGRAALEFAKRANDLDQGRHYEIKDILACAYAETGNFVLATDSETQAAREADAAKAADRAAVFRERLALFRDGHAYHEPGS